MAPSGSKFFHFALADPAFGQGGPKIFFQDFAHIAKQSQASEASQYWPGSRAHLRALEALVFLHQICILPLFLVLFLQIFNVHLCGYIIKYLFQSERFWPF